MNTLIDFIKINHLSALNSPDVRLVVGMHEDCYRVPRGVGGSLRRHPDPVRRCAVPPATPEVHQVADVDHDGVLDGAGAYPCAVQLLNFQATKFIL